ncbi:glycosyltransferase family 2 protein [Salegentibacter salegens]|uniref:Glycosyltransferase involved in cell wall bisynthesis n=1 Tax=Salegentibacter salegens TaxID=143223 RepID=A0A1M7NEC9_9FLAO|nr:glycosyltransferase [Salegentibacter salegens]PRX46304.1 glycosyltransferase involved in cell wall biosynthesis [Salegentibacter salegens]SHN02028.1 Glycosyltransferase involved in cell wall bisynthesis [Salegentibacter salegens]
MKHLLEVDPKLVSIILPVYNGEKFLDQSIQSCLEQTYVNIELIIVDDCSTDNSYKIAREFQKKDKRVVLIQNTENKQLPASLNIGHKVAKGSYLTWTSDDNFYEPNAIERMVVEIEKSGIDITYSNFNIIEENGGFKRKFVFNEGSTILLGNTVGACFLYKKEVFDRNNGYDEELHTVEDYDFWLQASIHSHFNHIPDYLYNFRIHKNSLSYHLNQKHSSSKVDFNSRLIKSYSKFFRKLEFSKERGYSQLFSKLHQHRRIDVFSFFKNYSSFEKDMKRIYRTAININSESNVTDIDLRLRGNIETYKKNQNIRTLIEILKNRPVVLMGYSRSRGFRIILKCLF